MTSHDLEQTLIDTWQRQMTFARSGRAKDWSPRAERLSLSDVCARVRLLQSGPVARRLSTRATDLKYAAARFIAALAKYEEEMSEQPDGRFYRPSDLRDAVAEATRAAEVFIQPTWATGTKAQTIHKIVSECVGLCNALDMDCPPIPASAQKALVVAAQQAIGLRVGGGA